MISRCCSGRTGGACVMGLTGVHNQLNALAAIAAAEHVGVAPDQAAQALARFSRTSSAAWNCAARCAASASMTTLPTTPRPCAPRSMACAGAWAPRRASRGLRAAQQHHEAGHHESAAALGLEAADLAFATPLGWTGMPPKPWRRWARSTAADVDQLATDLVPLRGRATTSSA